MNSSVLHCAAAVLCCACCLGKPACLTARLTADCAAQGRVVFGNRLVPTTLIVSVEEARCLYSTKPAASQHDLFMHYVKMTAENFKVRLERRSFVLVHSLYKLVTLWF